MKKSILKTIAKPWWLIDEENTISYKMLKGFTDALDHLPKSLRKRAFRITEKTVVLFSRFFLF